MNDDTHMTSHARKQQLLAQAAQHRLHLGQARQAVSEGMHSGALAKAGLGVGLAALAMLRAPKRRRSDDVPARTGIAALLPFAAPLAMRGLSLLSRLRLPGGGKAGPGDATGTPPASGRGRTGKIVAAGLLGVAAAYAVKAALRKRG